MTQLTLVLPNEQARNLKRVSSRISQAIMLFCKDIGRDGEFFAEDLLNHVERWVGSVAPDSPGRILRQLRRQGRIDYEIVSRRNSHYRILRVGP